MSPPGHRSRTMSRRNLSPLPAAVRSLKRAGCETVKKSRNEHAGIKPAATFRCAGEWSMCGIFGYVGPRDPVPIIMGGLRSLEYRGYDSAGIAVVENGQLAVRRSSGKLRNLEELLEKSPLTGHFGLGHTRWATHGRPTEENAHPHRDCKGRIVVAHNGIIENYLQLKRQLTEEGHKFT